jgi:hypothetical protein
VAYLLPTLLTRLVIRRGVGLCSRPARPVWTRRKERRKERETAVSVILELATTFPSRNSSRSTSPYGVGVGLLRVWLRVRRQRPKDVARGGLERTRSDALADRPSTLKKEGWFVSTLTVDPCRDRAMGRKMQEGCRD